MNTSRRHPSKHNSLAPPLGRKPRPTSKTKPNKGWNVGWLVKHLWLNIVLDLLSHKHNKLFITSQLLVCLLSFWFTLKARGSLRVFNHIWLNIAKAYLTLKTALILRLQLISQIHFLLLTTESHWATAVMTTEFHPNVTTSSIRSCKTCSFPILGQCQLMRQANNIARARMLHVVFCNGSSAFL